MSPRQSDVGPSQVRAAVLSLRSQNLNPTVVAVRDYLGGGSTKIISEHLRDQKAIEATSEVKANEISAYEIFKMITSELAVPWDDSPKGKLFGVLSCYFGQHYKASSMSVRAYINAGFKELEGLERSVEEELSKNYELVDDDDSGSSIASEIWLHALSCAIRKIDRKELAIYFAEDWVDQNET